MLEKMPADDTLLHEPPFTDEEVPYNLLFRICDSNDALRLKRSDGSLIYAQNPGLNGWLWMQRDLSDEEAQERLAELIEYLGDRPVPGVCARPATADFFAHAYAAARGYSYRTNMMLEAYRCEEAVKPLRVKGSLRSARRDDVPRVAEFLAEFAFDAFGLTVKPSSQVEDAESAVASGGLYLWQVQGLPVSMASIAHRSRRHARINGVYTPRNHRKNGYASALVAELSAVAASEGRNAMLYADKSNPDSNKVYRNIGFIESGNIKDIKFS
ncbi:GNAT family N-acetyltransferase [Cohnella faecalis]|uniref:GNAT family N-acetyltransferase n=1 Tax=Cohnella faecalis TaxID=2315694 RepID=A0A398CLX5_9BACL|nr:GNAT family N-acetyltransferase [Cohnella faecalis]RIE01868.1 GNAT family N-acetyltransferase [Cohnella faecalis]RIE04919.1 GNAT family N-acetyltransferase [Cohnella faecalis]